MILSDESCLHPLNMNNFGNVIEGQVTTWKLISSPLIKK